MPYSKTCKLVAFGAIGVSAILVLVTIYSFSSSKCPESGHLMHRQSSTCYPRESKGPCQHNLIFLEESPKSDFGDCSCPYTKSNRTMLYHGESERCYFVFTQAYCDEGHWLTILTKASEGLKRGSPICEKNPCLQHHANGLQENGEDDDKHAVDYESVEWVPIKGGCARLNSHIKGCPEGSVVTFHKGYILPSCFKPHPVKVTGAALGVPASSCSLGSYPSIMGKCQPDFEFDFDEYE